MTLSLPETRASLILRLPDPGDVAAWDQFVAIYGPVVFRLARRQGMQVADADDLVQEVLTAVARSISKWLDRSDRGTFRAWLFRIARNASVNHLTRRSTRPLALWDDGDLEALAEVADVESPLASQFDIEYRRELFRWASERVKQMFAETTWQSFWLTHVRQQPIGDVADQLGISVGSVYVGRSRVMARLRETVKSLEETR